jgi:hypothetical protein
MAQVACAMPRAKRFRERARVSKRACDLIKRRPVFTGLFYVARNSFVSSKTLPSFPRRRETNYTLSDFVGSWIPAFAGMTTLFWVDHS